MRTADPIVTFSDVIAIGGTERGLKCRPIAYVSRQFWVPKAQIAPASEVKATGDRGALIVSKWWADVSKAHLNFRATE